MINDDVPEVFALFSLNTSTVFKCKEQLIHFGVYDTNYPDLLSSVGLVFLWLKRA